MMVTNRMPQMMAPLKLRDIRMVMIASPAIPSQRGASDIYRACSVSDDSRVRCA